MNQPIDRANLEALERLLARPDPHELPHRSHTYRCDGDPDRRSTRLPAIHMGWLQRRHLRVDAGEALVTARPARRPAPAQASDRARQAFSFGPMVSRFTTR